MPEAYRSQSRADAEFFKNLEAVGAVPIPPPDSTVPPKPSRFDRWTDRARKVAVLAEQEAARLDHRYIGTEHLLLGLIKEGSGVAANVLKNMGINLADARKEIEALLGAPTTPEHNAFMKLAVEFITKADRVIANQEAILEELRKPTNEPLQPTP